MFEVLIVERPTLPPRCQLRIGITAKGPSCLRLTLNGSVAEPLTAAGIRLPLRELVDEVVDQAALLGEERLPTKAEREAFGGELAATFPRAEPGKRLPDELLEEVARVYRYALQRGLPPTEAVKEALDVSRSTAGRYVVRARRAGLLGRASPGVAGELEPKGGNNG